MKRLVFMMIPALICGVIFTSCSHKSEEELTDGLWLKMGDNSIVHTSDIDYYDVSRHIIYLKKGVPYFNNVHGTVSVLVGDDEIYECPIHSFVCSHIVFGQPCMYVCDFTSNKDPKVILIYFNTKDEQQVTDPRNDPRIIAALKRHGQYHK